MVRVAGPTARLPNAAREEAEQREHKDDDEDDPEDSHGFICPPFLWIYNVGNVLAGTGNGIRHSIAGLTPYRSRSSTYSAAARFARDGDGDRSARSITFFAVCSAATNSITSTRYPAISSADARSASVTRSACRPSRSPCRRRPSLSFPAICAASSWWQHGATTI